MNRTIRADEDPVCGMTVDIEQARARDLVADHDGHEFGFCGKGCRLEFLDAPERYLAADYQASM